MKMLSLDLIMLSDFGPSAGGRETWACNFIPLLLRMNRDVRVSIYGLSKAGIDNSTYILDGVDVNDRERVKLVFFKEPNKKRCPLFFYMLIQLRRYARSKDFKQADILLGVGVLSEMLLMLFAFRPKCSKSILWLRSIFCSEKANRVPRFLLPFLRWAEIFFLKKADIMLANGDDIMSYYKQYGLKVDVIKNGVDRQKWAMPLPEFKLPLKIAFVGRLAKAKGIEEFLHVAQKIKKDRYNKELEFHVVGDGPFLNLVKKLADDGVLIYHGVVENKQVKKYLAMFDVCVALTFSAKINGGGGTSNALLEQMAAGRAIIAWDNEHFRQLLNDDSAYFVRQGNTDELVQVMYNVIEDVPRAITKSKLVASEVLKYSLERQMNKFALVLSKYGIEV